MIRGTTSIDNFFLSYHLKSSQQRSCTVRGASPNVYVFTLIVKFSSAHSFYPHTGLQLPPALYKEG